jgi:hypothetical protein
MVYVITMPMTKKWQKWSRLLMMFLIWVQMKHRNTIPYEISNIGWQVLSSFAVIVLIGGFLIKKKINLA